ncbi:hypothetical protein [Pseudonocardia sp. MH-G8]|uniref:hypothetical protein n=1 Tax=Pseudonocardia sp. MH-G8 TaxID=1854588 RepID=UPI000BA0790F|nr:hypothetical protein [Pseudonocardia sp. MH-G8]OZM80368.1 hypothetical protein CFP66_19575 [Pseudonocardia sp. MH-G8]
MRTAMIRVALVLVAGLVAAGCAVEVAGTPSPAPAAVGRPDSAAFSDASGRFSLVPPPGWSVDTSGTQDTAVIFADPLPVGSAGGRFRANINVIVLPAGADLPTTVASARQELTGLPHYRPTADEGITLADGSRAQLLGGTFDDPGSGLALRNVQLLSVHAGATVVVTGTTLAGEWAGHGGVLESSLRSLTVIG